VLLLDSPLSLEEKIKLQLIDLEITILEQELQAALPNPKLVLEL